MQEFTTPMMKQYGEIKKQYADCLLLYRMGDFYELFLEDAYIGAKVLDITLTGKSNGKNGRIPMAGVPYHAVDTYLTKLVKAGYKVAICEQVSEPTTYGLVEREVVRIVTPGTILDEKALDKKDNNYIVSLNYDSVTLAISIADISTGEFQTMQTGYTDLHQVIRDELSRIHPSECILPEHLYNQPDLLKTLKIEREINISLFSEWEQYARQAEIILKKQFGVTTLAAFGIEGKTLTIETAATLLGYLKYTQQDKLKHFKRITLSENDDYVQLDRSTMINLELFTTIRDHDLRGSLISVLDLTHTAMGGRLLKQWLRKPLCQKEAIESRHESVEELLATPSLLEELQNHLKTIADIERLLSRLSVGIGNARDLINLKQTLQGVLAIKETVSQAHSELLQNTAEHIALEITHIIKHIETAIVPEPPLGLREGGLIQKGINQELDTLYQKIAGSKKYVFELEEKERKRTSINSLKVRFNKVFGFYIEVSKANAHLVPEDYMRKQTLVNGERFITEELKKHEELILTAEEKINALEYSLFMQILSQVLEQTEAIQKAAASIATLDCLGSFALLAAKEHFVRPTLLYSGEMRITAGRHPVVEKLLGDATFVPNDTILDNISQQLLIITGPNMAGKSVYIRQVALIVLLAQIGSFVPAEKAHVSVVDRIFVRSGASDVITSGLSTFMVEMVETAHILHHATKNSLIIMDEIGRGTSTYDGISIAWAVAEYLATKSKSPPKTLFATHYHELQALEEQYPHKIKNYHMAVIEERGEPIFLHTILPGGASHSFGVAVAKLAGIPEPVIMRAKEILATLENRQVENPVMQEVAQNTTYDIASHLLQKELSTLDISTMTPLEALNTLADLKKKLQLFTEQNQQFIEADN